MEAQHTELQDSQKIKVVFLGDRSVGKTSIIKRFTRDQFSERQNPTIGIDYMFKTIKYHGRMYKLELWDTAGQEKYRSLIKNYLKDADCALFIHDLSEPQTYYRLLDWIDAFNDTRKPQDTLTLIVGNKLDLNDELSRDMIDINLITNRQLHQLDQYQQLTVSAKDGTNINSLFQKILREVEEIRKIRTVKNKTQDNTVKVGMASNMVKKRCCLG